MSQPQGGDHVGTQLINSRDQQHGGSNEDMKKVLMSLDNTGYFAEVRKTFKLHSKSN